MRKRLIYLLFFLSVFSYAKGADNLRLADTRTLGLGGSGAVYSPMFNPALTAFYARRQVRADYFDRYALKELGTLSGGLCMPNPILPFGVHIASFGYDKYRESLFRLSVAKRLSRIWSIGVSVQYNLLQSELFERSGARLSADLGVALRPTDEWMFGLSVIHFPSVSTGSDEVNDTHLASLKIVSGLRYVVSEGMELSVGGEYRRDEPFVFSVGMEYAAFADFRLRAGVRSSPFSPSLGACYSFIGLTLDTAILYHSTLGTSIGCGLSYTF